MGDNASKYLGRYAGIGSRDTPEEIQEMMREIAASLRKKRYLLCTGGARGADRAFEKGAKNRATRVYLPDHATEKGIELASRFHPAWDKCDDFVRKLHGRNAHIMLGYSLSKPVDFVVCWTKNGKDMGGTGLGMRIAEHYQIDIYNLFFAKKQAELDRLIREL